MMHGGAPRHVYFHFYSLQNSRVVRTFRSLRTRLLTDLLLTGLV